MARTTVAVALLVALNGLAHGVWTHRWEDWSETGGGRRPLLGEVPLRVGDWEGERLETNPLTHPEEVVGRGETVRYQNRADGTVVTVYLSHGPTDGLVSHTPRACYTANGYTCVGTDPRLPPEVPGVGGRFRVSSFSRTDSAVATHLRVFWAWSDGAEWQTPDNPRRTFRRLPAVYKCYVVRELAVPDEPVDEDPALRLLELLLPKLQPGAAAGA